jgi:hypothetical protein
LYVCAASCQRIPQIHRSAAARTLQTAVRRRAARLRQNNGDGGGGGGDGGGGGGGIISLFALVRAAAGDSDDDDEDLGLDEAVSDPERQWAIQVTIYMKEI